jgi:recombination protein RecR
LQADPLARLILEFSKLPGIGEKTAMRLAYHVLRTNEGDVAALSQALLDAKTKILLCERCFNFTDKDICKHCEDQKRIQTLVCVVEKPSDVVAEGDKVTVKLVAIDDRGRLQLSMKAVNRKD